MENRKLNLLQTDDPDYFLDCIDEFYSVIAHEEGNKNVDRVNVSKAKSKSYLLRAFIKFPLLWKLKIQFNRKKDINFASMISGDFRLITPFSFFSPNNYIYMYDVWPRFQKWIFPLLQFFNIKYVFFSSKQVFDSYLVQCPHSSCSAMWVPEAIDISRYHFKDYNDKDIDVMEFGRMFDEYHDKIANTLNDHKKNHVFRKNGQLILFPSVSDFKMALARSKIVICVPSNISHPERAENISTMTLRYLQAMASKCLIVGILPSDILEIFGYNPIVEIEFERADEQIIEVLANFDGYQKLIEKNYHEVKYNHQWHNRWKLIKSKITESYE